MRIKFGGKSTVAQQGECAELRQRVEGDEQNAAQQGWAELRKDDPHKRSPGALAERARGFLERRIKAAQRSGYGQVDERIVSAGHDKQRSGKSCKPLLIETQA